jgi:PPOX class probable F420-dependent enzyme
VTVDGGLCASYRGAVDKLSDDVIAFLSEGTRTGMLGYLASDGRPLVAPVWFVVDKDAVAFNTGKDTAKGRAIARDPRVVMCVDDPHPPYSFVQIQGVATISEDPQDLLDIATRTGGRYMGADRAEEFGRRNGVPGELVVRITPTRVRSAFDLAN